MDSPVYHFVSFSKFEQESNEDRGRLFVFLSSGEEKKKERLVCDQQYLAVLI